LLSFAFLDGLEAGTAVLGCGVQRSLRLLVALQALDYAPVSGHWGEVNGCYTAAQVFNHSIWNYLLEKGEDARHALEGKRMHMQPARFTLYSGPLSMLGAKAHIAALEKGLEFELIMVAYDSHLGYYGEVLLVSVKVHRSRPRHRGFWNGAIA
jgi:hypothetical protein